MLRETGLLPKVLIRIFHSGIFPVACLAMVSGAASIAFGDPSYADFIGEDTAASTSIPKTDSHPAATKIRTGSPAMILKSADAPQPQAPKTATLPKPPAKVAPQSPVPKRQPFSQARSLAVQTPIQAPIQAPDQASDFFISDHLTPGAQVRTYPIGGAPAPAMTDAVTLGGHPSLEINLKADDYSGCAVCAASPMDMQSSFQKGLLEFWVKGETGGEAFNIGLLDDGENEARRPLQVWVNARSYAVTSGSAWSRVRIPLASLGSRGGYWAPESSGPLYSGFNWSGVRCLTLDIDKGRQKTFRVWMAGARLIRTAPQVQPPQHAGYLLRNEPKADSQDPGAVK